MPQPHPKQLEGQILQLEAEMRQARERVFQLERQLNTKRRDLVMYTDGMRSACRYYGATDAKGGHIDTHV